MAGQWTPRPAAVEHTFKSSRVALLRRELPMAELIRSGAWTDELIAAFDASVRGELEDRRLGVALWDTIVCAMFVEPRIVPDADFDPSAYDADLGPFPISVLDEDEMDEVIEAAFGGAASSITFRRERPDEAPGASSAGVEGDAGEPDGVPTGEPRGARARPPRSGKRAAKRRGASAA